MDTLKLTGKYHLVCRDKEGNIKWEDTVNNLITSAGKAQLALCAGDASAVPFLYIAVGTSTTAVAVGDTTLTAEIVSGGLSRAAGTVSRTTTTVTNDTYQITKTFTASASHTVEEIGVLTASSGGVLLSHALTGTKVVTSGDTLACTYKLAFA